MSSLGTRVDLFWGNRLMTGAAGERIKLCRVDGKQFPCFGVNYPVEMVRGQSDGHPWEHSQTEFAVTGSEQSNIFAIFAPGRNTPSEREGLVLGR